MTDSIGYYTNYNPQTCEPHVLHWIQDKYGSSLEQMSYEQKVVMRTALCTFVSQKPVWQEDGNVSPLIDLCIESAGVDWDIWCVDADLVEAIRASSYLEEDDIEGLILALASQIKNKLYSSRVADEWMIVSL